MGFRVCVVFVLFCLVSSLCCALSRTEIARTVDRFQVVRDLYRIGIRSRPLFIELRGVSVFNSVWLNYWRSRFRPFSSPPKLISFGITSTSRSAFRVRFDLSGIVFDSVSFALLLVVSFC